jgi:hypothetical protein
MWFDKLTKSARSEPVEDVLSWLHLQMTDTLDLVRGMFHDELPILLPGKATRDGFPKLRRCGSNLGMGIQRVKTVTITVPVTWRVFRAVRSRARVVDSRPC